MEVGESLNILKNIEFLEGSSLEELRLKLREVHIPYKLISIYKDGSKHVAWIQPTGRFNKERFEKKLSKQEK